MVAAYWGTGVEILGFMKKQGQRVCGGVQMDDVKLIYEVEYKYREFPAWE